MNRARWFGIRPTGLIDAAAAFACAGTVGGFLATLWWGFDLCTHFRVQYLITLTLVATVHTCRRKHRVAAILAGVAIVNLIVIAPYLIPHAGGAPIPSGTSLRALLVNVNTANNRYDLVRELVRKTDPDIMVVEEVDAIWMAELAVLTNHHPHVLAEPREDNFGMAMFSKRPLADARIVRFGKFDLPSATATISVGGRSIRVIGTHPLPPGSRHGSEQRNAQLAALAEWVRSRPGPVVVLGDLNVSPWSPWFARLLSDTGLRDSARGRGIHATWPTSPVVLRIPIDHCLLSEELHVIRREVGPDIGSDHFPLIVEFGF